MFKKIFNELFATKSREEQLIEELEKLKKMVKEMEEARKRREARTFKGFIKNLFK